MDQIVWQMGGAAAPEGGVDQHHGERINENARFRPLNDPAQQPSPLVVPPLPQRLDASGPFLAKPRQGSRKRVLQFSQRMAKPAHAASGLASANRLDERDVSEFPDTADFRGQGDYVRPKALGWNTLLQQRRLQTLCWRG